MCVCVYIYLFLTDLTDSYLYIILTDQFPLWCVRDLFPVGLESMHCLSLWTVLQTSPCPQ